MDSSPAPAWQPDSGAMHGLADIGGIFNPLGLAAYNTYVGGMGARGSARYNLLNVKYVLAEKGKPPGDERFAPVFDHDPQIDVYLNKGALPRALLIGKSIPVTSGEQAWAEIHRPGFDPSREALIEGGPVLNGAPPDGALAIRRLDVNEIELDAKTSTPAYLVLSEVYYPGWRAEIDGRPAKIGVQEEAPPLGKPVLVLRNVRERPEGLTAASARLVGTRAKGIIREVSRILQDRALYAQMARPSEPYGDGHAAQRIVSALLEQPRNVQPIAAAAASAPYRDHAVYVALDPGGVSA